MKVISFLLDLLYPPRCAFCHDFLETGREGVCAHCRTGLPFAQNGGRQHFPFIPACVSPLNYEGNVRESLLRYKFGGATGYAKVYGRLVAETVRTELPGAYDIITWVPLSRMRRANITGAYRMKKGADVTGKRVLLIDDIVTTGSTLLECARVLGKAGAEQVVCATVARAAD